MNNYKRVLTIAGSDSGGGAGIQADIKTISALGCYASSVITAITAQNTVKVIDIEVVRASLVEAQLRAVLDDIGADAIKIGMLGNGEVADVVANVLEDYSGIDIVLDPVLVATSGDVLSKGSVIDVIMSRLVPLARVVTPNIDEAFAMSGVNVKSVDDYEKVWSKFEQIGCKALLLKGGHCPIEGHVFDVLFETNANNESNKQSKFVSDFIQTANTHGTGCTLSSAIAAFLAHDDSLEYAVERATAYVHHAIATAAEYKIGKGHGPVHHFYKVWQ